MQIKFPHFDLHLTHGEPSPQRVHSSQGTRVHWTVDKSTANNFEGPQTTGQTKPGNKLTPKRNKAKQTRRTDLRTNIKRQTCKSASGQGSSDGYFCISVPRQMSHGSQELVISSFS